MSTWWSSCQHPCSRQHRDTCLISLESQGQHRKPWTWSSLCWHGALYFPCCQPSMPWVWTPGFGHTLLLGVRNEHQVIRIEQLPWHSSVELARQHFQHQDEEQWAKERALMHSQLPRQTPHCINHWPAHGSGHCRTCPGWHAQPIRPHPGSSMPTTGPFLTQDRKLSQGRQRQNRAVC